MHLGMLYIAIEADNFSSAGSARTFAVACRWRKDKTSRARRRAMSYQYCALTSRISVTIVFFRNAVVEYF